MHSGKTTKNALTGNPGHCVWVGDILRSGGYLYGIIFHVVPRLQETVKGRKVWGNHKNPQAYRKSSRLQQWTDIFPLEFQAAVHCDPAATAGRFQGEWRRETSRELALATEMLLRRLHCGCALCWRRLACAQIAKKKSTSIRETRAKKTRENSFTAGDPYWGNKIIKTESNCNTNCFSCWTDWIIIDTGGLQHIFMHRLARWLLILLAWDSILLALMLVCNNPHYTQHSELFCYTYSLGQCLEFAPGLWTFACDQGERFEAFSWTAARVQFSQLLDNFSVVLWFLIELLERCHAVFGGFLLWTAVVVHTGQFHCDAQEQSPQITKKIMSKCENFRPVESNEKALAYWDTCTATFFIILFIMTKKRQLEYKTTFEPLHNL